MDAAAAWFTEAGAYPVNHLLCLKTPLVEAHPWLPAELMRLFVAAKAAATEPSAEARFSAIAGLDPLPYGLEENRPGIELCLRYAAEQGLVPRAYMADEIFVQQTVVAENCTELHHLWAEFSPFRSTSP